MLTSSNVRDRIQRQLSVPQIEQINEYTERTFRFATDLIKLSERAKALYSLSRDCLITAEHLEQQAAGVNVEPLLQECLALIEEHKNITALLTAGASPSVLGVLWENRLSLVLCAFGIGLVFAPGGQLGLTVWMEKIIAYAGVTLTVLGAGTAYMMSKNFKSNEFLTQLQESLSTVRNDMQEVQCILSGLGVYQGAAMSASDKLKLKTISETLISLFTDLSDEGIKIQRIASEFPRLKKKETLLDMCVIS